MEFIINCGKFQIPENDPNSLMGGNSRELG